MADRRWSAALTGYSGTPQARKLGLVDGCRVDLVGAPAGWELRDPPAVVWTGRAAAADVLLAFVRARVELDAVPSWGERIFPAGALWVAWPRKAAGHRSDVDENAIREAALPLGLVDTKVAAIDEDWSGLKLVWRKDRRQR
jgi:Protein of unknown function (DUF3052)